MIKVGVFGATGYAGVELIRLLSMHKHAEITMVSSQTFAGKPLSDVYKNLKGIVDIPCTEADVEMAAKTCDVVFTALPHGASKAVIPALVEKGLKVIDLSGDFRYKDVAVYEKWYGQEHTASELLKKAVYGLPELHREEIKKTSLVGNPGCYTTCSILGLAPLAKAKIIDMNSIIIDAKSGVSGGGRSTSLGFSYSETDETMKAYKVATHRHTSEIEQEIGLLADREVALSFTPHLVPLKRGIFATIYANLSEKFDTEALVEMYREFYKDEYFVRIHNAGELPELKYVAGSNFVDIGLVADARLSRVIVVSCLDNLIKGAAGQAVQNMNLLFGIDETEGLTMPAYYL